MNARNPHQDLTAHLDDLTREIARQDVEWSAAQEGLRALDGIVVDIEAAPPPHPTGSYISGGIRV